MAPGGPVGHIQGAVTKGPDFQEQQHLKARKCQPCSPRSASQSHLPWKVLGNVSRAGNHIPNVSIDQGGSPPPHVYTVSILQFKKHPLTSSPSIQAGFSRGPSPVLTIPPVRPPATTYTSNRDIPPSGRQVGIPRCGNGPLKGDKRGPRIMFYVQATFQEAAEGSSEGQLSSWTLQPSLARAGSHPGQYRN